MEFGIQTSDFGKEGTYNLRFSARFDEDSHGNTGWYTATAYDFDVILQNACSAATLTVPPSILPSTTITQSLYKPEQVLTLDPSQVTSTETTASCPAIELHVVDMSGALIDAADPYLGFDSVTNELTSYQQTDKNTIRSTDLRVRAKYAGAYTNYGILTFTHTVDDPCQSATITIDPSIISANPINYSITYPLHLETMLYTKISHDSHVDCPNLLYELTNQDGTSIDLSIFTVTS